MQGNGIFLNLDCGCSSVSICLSELTELDTKKGELYCIYKKLSIIQKLRRMKKRPQKTDG